MYSLHPLLGYLDADVVAMYGVDSTADSSVSSESQVKKWGQLALVL